MTFIVYVLFSEKLNKFYAGYTDNLSRRLEEHNSGKGKFTSKGVPWKLIYNTECKDRSEAARLETKIKKRGIARYLTDINFGM